MLCHGLSCTKSARNSGSTAFGDGEKCVKDTLACNKRNTCRETQLCRSWNTDRPFLCKRQIFCGSVRQFNGYNRFQNVVLSIRSCFDDSSVLDRRRNHGFMKNGGCFLCLGNDRTGTHNIPLLNCNMSVPFFLCIQRIYTDTSGNIFSGGFCNFLQRTLDSVKNVVDDSRSQKNRDGVACSCNGFPRTKPCGFLKNLDGGHSLFQANDLSYQVVLSYIDHLGDFESGIAFQINNRAVDTVDNTCFTHSSALRQI